jgi:tRNA 2-selenouridine synthase
VAARDFPLMVELVLDYYDKTYTYGLAQRPGEPERTFVPVESCDPQANAAALLQVSEAVK